MDPIVYIDRVYDDGFDEDPPWPRRRRWSPSEPEWQAGCDYKDHFEESPGFNTVEEAIQWGRERSPIVLVRLGSALDAVYSAGDVQAAEKVDGSGLQFPKWPPPEWPDYNGPNGVRSN